jgi:N-acyl-L-homoserine lactone synthetase
MQLWVAWDNEEKKVRCVCITEIKQYPKYKVCGCKITTGNSFKQWVDFMDYVMEWAKEEGCRKMEIHTRPGWERILKPKGFFKTHVQLERIL